MAYVDFYANEKSAFKKTNGEQAHNQTLESHRKILLRANCDALADFLSCLHPAVAN